MKGLKYYGSFLFCLLSYCLLFRFNIQLAKKRYRWQFFIFKGTVFLFLPFLNLGAQIRCPKNRYNDIKSDLQPQ